MKIICYGGVNTIGGNKIFLEDGDTRIFLDFGMDFTDNERFFTDFMPERKCSRIKDLITLGLLPNLKGLYRRDYCSHMGLSTVEENMVDAVVISHAHLDHMDYVSWLREDIPICVSAGTKVIMNLFDTVGFGSEFLQINPSFMFVEKKRGEGLKRRTARDGVIERNIQTFTQGSKFKIGDLEILPCAVDHSLTGATAFIIYTSVGPVIYTGDLRFHGRHPKNSAKFVEEAAKDKPIIMLSEGTRVDQLENVTEEDVETRSATLIKNERGIVIADFPIRDTDRLQTFYNVAVNNGRKLAIETRQALLLKLLRENGIAEFPEPTDKNLAIFLPRKGWGLIGRQDVPSDQIEDDYQPWEKEFLAYPNAVMADDIRGHQSNYVVFSNSFQLNNLLDIQPLADSTYIRSLCEPFTESMELDSQRVKNWLERFGLSPGYHIHASGHANGKHLLAMIEQINPTNLMPIHTKYPKLLAGNRTAIMPELGKTYSF
jgi:ribonuclease J